MSPLDQRRFLFVTGKGGTGKTTVTAALALALAARGRRVLVAVTEPKERIGALLGVPPLTADIALVRPNIWAVKIDPEVAMREYGEMILRSRTVSSALFDNRTVRGFFAAVPGLHQWAMLGKAWYHSTELAADGGPRFDCVLFDAPATGHGLDMLRVPKVIVDVVPPGVLRRDAERAWATFRDERTSGVVIVSLAEDMPATESTELAAALRSELGLPIAAVVANQVVEPLFTPAEQDLLRRPRTLLADDAGDRVVEVATRRATLERAQAESLEKLTRGVAAPVVQLPRLLGDAGLPASVEALARILGASLAAVGGGARP